MINISGVVHPRPPEIFESSSNLKLGMAFQRLSCYWVDTILVYCVFNYKSFVGYNQPYYNTYVSGSKGTCCHVNQVDREAFFKTR